MIRARENTDDKSLSWGNYVENAVEIDNPIPSLQRHRHRLADRPCVRLRRLPPIVPWRQCCGGGEVGLFGFGVGAEMGAGADPECVIVQERDLDACRVSVACTGDACAQKKRKVPGSGSSQLDDSRGGGTHVPLEVGRPRLGEAELNALQRPGDARHEIPENSFTKHRAVRMATEYTGALNY
eukprot:COSAG05_NODE_2621_length_2830_cov_575.029293_3_plen_182_part_00